MFAHDNIFHLSKAFEEVAQGLLGDHWYLTKTNKLR